MKYTRGFTIIELVVAMVIIAVLTSITVVAYNKVQQDTRDTTRKGNAAVISEALEKYYLKNGEYPSVRSLVNTYGDNTGTVVANKLGVKITDLRMPRMPSSATNGITATTPANDYIAYIASSDINAANCQSVLTGGCDQFTLQYVNESGNTVTIESRHKGRPDSLPTAPGEAPKPTVTVALSGTNVVATAAAAPCETGSLVAKFTFHYRVNGGAWSAYSNWGTANTYSVPGNQGSTYEFQAATRCDNGTAAGQSSVESDIVSFQYPIDTPANPVVTVTLSGSNALATITAVSCPAGTTAQYTLRNRVNDGTWSSYTAWSTSLTDSQAAAQGSKYGYQAKARCQLGSVVSDEATGTEATYIRPISTPAAPTAPNSTVGATTTWTISSASCPTGTTAEYQERDTTDWGYNSGWLGPYGSSFTGSSWNTASGEGYQFTEAFQKRCKTTYYTSSWSTSGSSSYIRPITTPAAPTGYAATLSGDRKTVYWSWNAPSCANAGLYAYDMRSARWPPGSFGSWSSPGWYTATWTQQIIQGGQPIVIPSGSQFQIRAQYECVNIFTGRTSSWGPIGTSAVYTAP